MKSYNSSGQVVLITLLVLTIATTVALSLISRTTTDTTITSQVEESSRAFNAAEAGIEEALRTGLGTNGAQSIVGAAGLTYSVSVATIGGATGAYMFPKKTARNATEALWLVNHDDTTGALIESPTYTASSISVCWSQETINPAMVITLFYKESSDGSYRVTKVAYESDAARRATNNFTLAISGNCGENTNTAYRQDIVFSSLNPTIDPTVDTLIALRIRPLYSDARIAIDSGGNSIPKQGNSIESTGTTITGTNRKILVYQQYRTPGTVFDAALYSQSTLVQ